MAHSWPTEIVEALRSRASRRIGRYGLDAETAERRRKHVDASMLTPSGELHCPDCMARGEGGLLAPWRFDRRMLWCAHCGFLMDGPAS